MLAQTMIFLTDGRFPSDAPEWVQVVFVVMFFIIAFVCGYIFVDILRRR